MARRKERSFLYLARSAVGPLRMAVVAGLLGACDAFPGTEGAECADGLCISGLTCIQDECREGEVWEYVCEAFEECNLAVSPRDVCESFWRDIIRDLPARERAGCIREVSACLNILDCTAFGECPIPTCNVGSSSS